MTSWNSHFLKKFPAELWITSVFLSSVLNFYDTLGVSPFEFFWDVAQDVAPVK